MAHAGRALAGPTSSAPPCSRSARTRWPSTTTARHSPSRSARRRAAHSSPRCLNESATPVRLEIVRITSPRGCCTYGRSMFAPVGRGTPGHPDRDRQRRRHPRDRSDAWPQRLDGRRGSQTQHVAPVRRVGSTPTAIAVSAGRAAFHAAAGGGADVAARGRRVSRFPDGFPSPDARRGIRRRTAGIAGPTGVLHL